MSWSTIDRVSSCPAYDRDCSASPLGLIVADGTDYRFHHHLVQEALYDELPPALRAAYHAALGDAWALYWRLDTVEDD